MVAMSDIPEWLRGIAPWRVAVTFHRRCFEKINEKYDCKVHYNIVDYVEHSHAGDLHIGIVEKAKEEMKNVFIMSTNTPSQVFAEVVNNLLKEALISMPKENIVKRTLRNCKGRMYPKKPQNLSELSITGD
ncbi:hypothetical protein QTP88_021886 [Uroleucon formosanum]